MFAVVVVADAYALLLLLFAQPSCPLCFIESGLEEALVILFLA